MTEKEVLQYIKHNKNFLKDFHNIYYNIQRNFLTGYSLKDYMITSYVSFNKIKDFNNYNSFKQQYLLQLNSDMETATELYEAYFDCFLENMEEYLTPLKKKYNKNNNDILIAYQIKTIWQFYSGFYDEKCLIKAVDNNSNSYNVYNREDKHLLDNNYAIDVEIMDHDNNIMAIQCKQLSYINLDNNKKEPHLMKHKRYRERFHNNTYYVLFQDNAPCYCITNNVKSYLIASTNISNVSYKNFNKGTFEDLILWLDNNNLEVKQ